MSEVTSLRRTPDEGCQTGAVCTWNFYDDDSDDEISVTGRLLGYATSKWQNHNHSGPPAKSYQTKHPAYKPCSACRWFEVRIIRQTLASAPGLQISTDMPSHAQYVVSFIGKSMVDGEVDRHTCVVTPSAYKIIEVLTQSRAGVQFIPRVSRLALAEAAGLDLGIEAAWIERPT